MHRIGAVILARLDSRRLPGKSLAEVAGRSLLDLVRSRIPATLLDEVPILATTDRAIDAPLAVEAEKLGLNVFRGDCDDVAGRLIAAACEAGLDSVLRVNGDSPFGDAMLYARAIELARNGDFDLVSNLIERSFPYGVSVELIRVATLAERLDDNASLDASDREHVTSALYRELGALRAVSLVAMGAERNSPATCVRLTIDEPSDLAALRRFAQSAICRKKIPWSAVSWQDALASGMFASECRLTTALNASSARAAIPTVEVS